MLNFDLDILPSENKAGDSKAAPVAVAPAKDMEGKLPPSLAQTGFTGKNTPPAVMDELQTVLEKKRQGRASSFTAEKAAIVVEGVQNGKTLEEMSKAISVDRSTLWAWMQVYPVFSQAIAEAREAQGHAMADDALEIVDNAAVNDPDPKQTAMVLRKAEIRSRTRLRLAEAYAPKTYSPKQTNLNLNVNTTIDSIDLSNYQ